MLSANAQELFLSNLMTDVIRADLSTLQRRKLSTLVSLFTSSLLKMADFVCCIFTEAVCV